MSSVAALAGLAADNLAQGRPADALRLIDGAIQKNSGERALIALRAQALYALGDSQAAAGTMAWLVAQQPGEAQAWVALGLLLQTTKLSVAAEQAFRRAQVVQPQSRNAARYLGRLRPDWPDPLLQGVQDAFDRGDWSAALSLLNGATARERLLLRAIAEARLGLGEQAQKFLGEAVPALPADQGAHWTARLLFERAGAANGDAHAMPHAAADFAEACDLTPELGLNLLRACAALDHPAFGRCGSKDALHHGISELLAAKGLESFPSYPESYLVPEEAGELAEAELSKVWIVRPMSGGRPHLTRTPTALGPAGGSSALIQEYVARPLILSGRKAHLRLYLAFPSPEWGRALLWDDGIVEFAPLPYGSESSETMDERRHLTKIDRHSGHPGIDRESDDGAASASIWSIKAYLSELGRQRGAKAAELAWSNLAKLARDTARLIDHAGILVAERQSPGRWSYPPKLLGIDCLLNEALKVFLLDLERRPEFAAVAPAERAVHARLGASFGNLCFAPNAGVPEGFIPLYAQSA